MNKIQILKSPIKSEGDKKNYRLIQLSNGLKALLIQTSADNSSTEDDNEIVAAASLTVGVGSFNDPSKVGGLAHFLEHMLFMGSEKYPEESGYTNFISSNGGSYNAMTENEYTTYFFDVPESSFSEALDRFSQQFVSPLLLQEALQREREAVDSEFEMAMTNDDIRTMVFYKIFINEINPASFFDYGNLQTLKHEISDDDLYEAVQSFFEKYVANNMNLSVQSKRSLDELQQLVVNNFSEIKMGEVEHREPERIDQIFKPKIWRKMFYVKPKQECQKLYLTWCLDSVDEHYKCNPLKYIKNIFSNKGEGGIADYLMANSLATTIDLEIGDQSFDSNSMFALVKVVVEMTDFGFENLERILDAIFSYLLMMKEAAVAEHRRLYDDFKHNTENDFKFYKEPVPIENVVSSAIAMKYYELDDVLRGKSLLQVFDEKVIMNIINQMNSLKFNLTIVTDKHEKFDQQTKYFGVEYEEQELSPEIATIWRKRKPNPIFFLEKPNPFKATDFEIFTSDETNEKHPVKIFEDGIFEVWHKLDSKYKMPYAYINISIISPKHMTSAQNSLLLNLFQKILIFNLSKKVYPALNAGLNILHDITQNGIEIGFYGYNEKIHMLIEIVTKSLKNLFKEADESIFETQRAELKKELSNSLLSAATLNTDYTSKALVNNHWTKYEKFREIDKITFEDIQKFSEKFLRRLKVQVLAEGNITRDQVKRIIGNLRRNLDSEPINYRHEVKNRGYQLPLGHHVLRMKSFMKDDDNSVTSVFYQAGRNSLRYACFLKLIASILDPQAFDYLRTKEQLGYSAEVAMKEFGEVLGLSIEVASQEHKHPCEEVQQKIETFMNVVARKIINELSDDEFESFREARVKTLQSNDLELLYEVQRRWNEIPRQDYMFDRTEFAARITKSLTKSQLQEFFQTITQLDERKLTIQVIGNLPGTNSSTETHDNQLQFINESRSETEKVITNIEEFQNDLFLYPSIKMEI